MEGKCGRKQLPAGLTGMGEAGAQKVDELVWAQGRKRRRNEWEKLCRK